MDCAWNVFHAAVFGAPPKKPSHRPAIVLHATYLRADTAGKEEPRVLPFEELPPYNHETHVRVICVSDTHEKHWAVGIPAGDVLIHAGDILLCNRRFSASGSLAKLADFNEWLEAAPVRYRFVVGGNHDFALTRLGPEKIKAAMPSAVFLDDEFASVDGGAITIFGSGLSFGTSGNTAYQRGPHEAREALSKLALALDSRPIVDVLVTHEPGNGSKMRSFLSTGRCRIHVGGHIHEAYGCYLLPQARTIDEPLIALVPTILSGKYKIDPHRGPIVIDIPKHDSAPHHTEEQRTDRAAE